MSFANAITRGKVSYIESIRYSAAENRLTIRFLWNPEESPIDRILTFSGIEDFSEESVGDSTEDSQNTLESLIGLDEHPEKGIIRYVVCTDSREMVFRTREVPSFTVLEDDGANFP